MGTPGTHLRDKLTLHGGWSPENHEQWFAQLCLGNEAPVNIVDTEAQRSFLAGGHVDMSDSIGVPSCPSPMRVFIWVVLIYILYNIIIIIIQHFSELCELIQQMTESERVLPGGQSTGGLANRKTCNWRLQ